MAPKKSKSIPLSPHVALLRQVRIPLWARVLGNIRKRLTARKERKSAKTRIVFMVTITDHWVFTDKPDDATRYHTWYTLSQYADGRRASEFGYSNPAVKGKELLSTTRNRYILPWVKGLIPNDRIREIARISNED